MTRLEQTFESLHNIRPYALGHGITARAIEADRMTIAVVELDPGAVRP